MLLDENYNEPYGGVIKFWRLALNPVCEPALHSVVFWF